jgi:hypothetical protein
MISYYEYAACESFIETCNELMIPADEAIINNDIDKATKEFKQLKKKVDEIKKEMNKCKDDPKKHIALLEETKDVLNESKEVINDLDISDSDVKTRKILSWICGLFLPWFIGIPIGIYGLKSVKSKNDALQYIEQGIKSADRKIAALKGRQTPDELNVSVKAQ